MADQFQLELWEKLTEAPGASGFEGPVRSIMKEYISSYTEEVTYDNMGSIFGVKRGDEHGPRIMVAGHMDEVGFMVTQISDKGFISFQALGGWWSQVLLAQRVQIITENGPIIGVISSIPPHVLSDDMRNRPMDIKKMYIDIGCDSKEDVLKVGVKPGHPIVPICPFTQMADPKKFMAKAWDNRYGCALSLELLKELHENPQHPNVIYAGATVQEEVGLRGAKTAAHMIDPDMFIALDASPAGDIPGVTDGMGKLGDGLLLRILDRTMIMQPGLRDLLIDTCEELGIKYQYFISQGGTDAGAVHMHGKGVPSVVIGIPSRYIHSHASIMHEDDYQNAKKLLFALVKKLDWATLEATRRR
ncbi:M42 family peptidase [Brevibacillus laterosporus]|uniref:M42 family peptidase n=1 Tax=Brevibacillus laterosporus TaxID=1465 RepID=A0A502IBG9_BRELA|nr:M42 family metallopeptidase [Brevibacillus laterosporus]QDX95609.1 M42 family peptidase [Brevibacillus laterosporus]TPG69517.1 M42 family peptidase [Brevibacillus laterosporus]TPG82986.1 M42 family peptidase [Brevibacillus laterosporus]